MLTYLGQAIVHALVAAIVVETLMRVWKVDLPERRLAGRMLALVLPVAALPMFVALAPLRSAPWFSERWAVLSISRWGQIQLAGIGLDALAVGTLATLGVVLYLFDLLPALRARSVDRALPVSDDPAACRRISAAVNRLPEELRANVPPIRIVRAATPVLLCSGLARLQLVVSTGAVATLDDDQLRAALAHEATHARYRDPLISWGLMAVRTAFFFSPATQLVARSAVNDVERRADDRSVALADDRLGMAGALVRLYAVSSPGSGRRSDAGGPAGRRLARWLHLGRTAAIERRCRRLLSPVAPHRDPYWPVQMTLTAISLAVLLFFVV